MTIEEIQDAIHALSLEDAVVLLRWCEEYYHGEIWDRQMSTDVERLGEDEFMRRLTAEKDDEQKTVEQACLNLTNNLRFASDADRNKVWSDLQIVLSAALKNGGKADE